MGLAEEAAAEGGPARGGVGRAERGWSCSPRGCDVIVLWLRGCFEGGGVEEGEGEGAEAGSLGWRWIVADALEAPERAGRAELVRACWEGLGKRRREGDGQAEERSEASSSRCGAEGAGERFLSARSSSLTSSMRL